MLTNRYAILQAIDLMTDTRGAYEVAPRELKEMASVLERFMDEGTFNGTLNSAIYCLEAAGYQIGREEN